MATMKKAWDLLWRPVKRSSRTTRRPVPQPARPGAGRRRGDLASPRGAGGDRGDPGGPRVRRNSARSY